MAYFFSSKELLSHHKIGKAAFYGNIIGLLIVFAWTLLPLISIRFSEKFKSYSHGLYGIGIGIAALAFTLVTEPINSNMSPERNTMQKVSNLYTNSYLEKLPTYVNHVWFFWANNLNKYDKKYQLVTKENLDSAEVGSICIWENHYSHRLSGDVQATYFTKHPEWIELDHHVSSKKNFRCFIYQKSNNNADSIMSLHDKYLSYQPFSAAGFSARGNTLSTKKNMKQESIKDYTKAIELDSNELSAYFNRGLAYFSLKKYDTAILNFTICFSKNNKWHQSMYNIAACELNLGNFQKSIIAYDKVLTIKSDYHEAILGRAKVHMRMRNNEMALSDLNLFIKLKPKHYDAIINRANIHLSKQNWLPALKDLTTCLKIKSGQSQLWYLKGICELNLQKKEESCKSLNKAHELGNKNALQYLSKVCQ